ncbi:MAG TPA: c-type cytochrome [Thermoanaerobaculia bacterium]|jgi:mono/diheme cytochrome c family protein|nr:c-type cytochrome [Thermoanaerobaculia bacterium]
MRRAVAVLVIVVVLVIAAAVVNLLMRGVSARDQPTRAEVVVARTMRRFAIPMKLRSLKNPIPMSAAALEEGRAHFADHCAQCHGNDGRGQTEMGRSLYPRAPDMTLPETQKLSDGELFAIIRNGVRLTGMPGWAGEHSEQDDWKLVLFIRHLPRMTKEEAESMKALNPVSPMEMREEQDEREFLSGGDSHK